MMRTKKPHRGHLARLRDCTIWEDEVHVRPIAKQSLQRGKHLFTPLEVRRRRRLPIRLRIGLLTGRVKRLYNMAR